MAATQPSLHNFYKARKSARETTLKNVKGSVVRDADVVKSVISEVNVEKNVNETVPRDAIATQRSTRRAAKTSSRKTQVKKPVQGTQDILTALRKVSEKAEAKASEKTEEEISIKSLQRVNVTPPVTPKRKKDEEEEDTKRKKRKQDNGEGELDRTPSGIVKDLPAPSAPRSAKKKLIMSSETEGTQVKKLTPAEIKERLGKCGRLDQLRAKLLKVNKCEEKLKQFKENTIAESLPPIVPPSPAKSKEHPQLAKFSSIEVEVPVSPRKTPVKTPSKTPLKAPAHERFQHLVEKPSEELVLPYKYRFLKDMFRAVDTVVSLLHNRHEVITYSKLKPAVQEMMRRAFEERHLGQIKTVFPLAYIFKQERRNKAKNVASNDVSKGPYELTVTSNMDYKGVSASQNLMSKFNCAPADNFPKFRKMDSVVLVERRNIFHNSLIDFVRDHHAEFLMTLEPPISSVGAIKRWHPEFALEDLPDIEEAALPQPPTMEKLETAKDVLEKAQDLFSLNHRLEKAVTEAAEKTPVPVAKTAPSLSAAPVSTCIALKGVSSSLLEKIRAREALKAAREMTRSCGENKELEMLSRLPEISRIIRNTFVTEKKAALPWEVVAAKVTASYSSMLGGNEVDSHLELLIKEIPGWCTVHNVRSGRFLKINKNEQLCSVEEKLQAIIKQRK
ncbi:DNA replication factor Cdt1-like isoform X1 [Penaeus monodon]|uniref:DNA replication factor Cdt1-like isoform X1 n=1 Tax=Penaeus monodon TaxID=6687 RepID=UPI0018A6D96C|nr:DNA replication factor Cdt1-like isoform X1 [Penaeus monodon]